VTLSSRDRRALVVLGGVLVVTLVYRAVSTETPEVVSTTGSIPIAEQRLARLRLAAAAVPAREQQLAAVSREVAGRENGLLNVETAAQAQAQLLQIVRRLGQAQAPPLVLGAVELGPIRPLGADYGEAVISVNFVSQVHQLVNLLADLAAQPELIATEELRVGVADPKQKMLVVRLSLAGAVPRRLAPAGKGLGEL